MCSVPQKRKGRSDESKGSPQWQWWTELKKDPPRRGTLREFLTLLSKPVLSGPAQSFSHTHSHEEMMGSVVYIAFMTPICPADGTHNLPAKGYACFFVLLRIPYHKFTLMVFQTHIPIRETFPFGCFGEDPATETPNQIAFVVFHEPSPWLECWGSI